MPMKEAHLRRYQVAVAFGALAASFILAVVAIQHATSTGHEQDRARIAVVTRLTHQISGTIVRTRALRARQLAALHAQAVRSCHSRHALATVLITLLTRSIADSRSIPIPGTTPEQQNAIDRRIQQGIATARDGLQLARKADCLHVAPLPKPRPHGH